MNYIMAPLEEHADDGYGAMAEAFLASANVLLAKLEGHPAFLDYLPRNYLLRHAVELYLKSGILILHRELDIAFGTEPSTADPMVPDNGKWKPYKQVHGVATLFAHWAELIESNDAAIRERCPKMRPDLTIPQDLRDSIATIEETDQTSTYYRYPTTREKKGDAEKSAFKDTSLEAIVEMMRSSDKGVKVSIVENSAGEFVRAAAMDDSAEKKTTAALEKAADILDSYHALMRMELTQGW